MNNRDEALACRYYYHAEIKRLRYDDCLGELEKEFFITASVIMLRLTISHSYLKGLVNEKATVNKLKKKYPFFSW